MEMKDEVRADDCWSGWEGGRGVGRDGTIGDEGKELHNVMMVATHATYSKV